MRKAQIKVGGHYTARVFGRLVTVRVDEINDGTNPGRTASGTRYHVTNLRTERKTMFRSAAKFRKEVQSEMRTVEVDFPPGANDGIVLSDRPYQEGEQRPNPTPVGPPATSAVALSRAAPSALADKLSALDAQADDSPHIIVEARAGTGKTTTLVEGLKRVVGLGSFLIPSPQQAMVWDCMELSAGKAKSICFVAFNRSIAAELKNRVPPGCEAMTMHGMGLRSVRSAFKLFGKEGGVNQWRVREIIGELMNRDPRDLQREQPVLVKATEELVGLCKMNLCDGDSDRLDQIASHYEVELNGQRDKVFALVPRVLERCKRVDLDGCVDYDDMIWLPVVLGLPVRRYDLLLVDEAQDLNRCQQALAKAAGKRLVLCGDPRQAIYGFAGADAESMKRMEDELGQDKRGCVKLYLTVTRRCGKAIVDEARKIVPDFEAFESNGVGKVSAFYFETKDHLPNRPANGEYRTHVADGDFLLCRVNAPLVSECFRFIKAGRRANIQGSDVSKGLVKLVEKLGARDVAGVITALGDWLDNEQRKEAAKKFPSESRMIALQDKHDCLLCFTDGLGSGEPPAAVVRRIESVFTDDKQAVGIRLSSIHKAKGLEAKRVFLLEPEGATVPHPMAKSPRQREQELNLRYVAITRAIEELVYVS